jgi:tubulin---tyrosine ligase
VTYIAQEYISRPLLYYGRKFDIRHYMLVTSVNGRMKGYWYKDGYLRTSSYPFDITSENMYVHLTNDAIQKKSEAYEKHELGNKVSYN